MAEAMRQTVASMLKGIDRYNPENLMTLERYVEIQSQENAYDLEANLAVLKLYQFNQNYNFEITSKILLKALTNFPHTDFILCKCLLSEKLCTEVPITQIIYLADVLECCDFQLFWEKVNSMTELIPIVSSITGFHDSIRKFVCHVVGITFQTIHRSLLTQLLGGVDGYLPDLYRKMYKALDSVEELSKNEIEEEETVDKEELGNTILRSEFDKALNDLNTENTVF